MLRPKPSRGVAQISISIADLYALDKAEVAKVLTKKIRKYRPIKVRERANSLIAKRALLRYKVSTPAIVKPNAQDSIIKALRNPTMDAKITEMQYHYSLQLRPIGRFTVDPDGSYITQKS